MQAQTTGAGNSCLTLGRRAAIELALSDARRDLAELVERRNGLLAQADVERALACEPGSGTVHHNTRAASLRLSAFVMDPDVAAARLRVRNLESQLKSAPAEVAPVVLSAAQCEAVDETAGLCGVL
jgi:hypothetical protein